MMKNSPDLLRCLGFIDPLLSSDCVAYLIRNTDSSSPCPKNHKFDILQLLLANV